jgi:hypothetical protein
VWEPPHPNPLPAGEREQKEWGEAELLRRLDAVSSLSPQAGRGRERQPLLHLHGISAGGLRLAAWHGPNNHPALKAGRRGEAMRDVWAIDVNKGGNAVPYHLEDPFIRREFEETMARRRGVAHGAGVV